MQLRSTTPVSYSALRMIFVVLIGLFFLIFASTTTTANSNTAREKRIKELSHEIDKTVSSTRELTKQSESLESQLDAIKAESNHLQSLISKNSNDQAVVEENIKKTERVLENQRALLGATMADMYVDDQISPLEVLASSHSIADYIDAQEMRQIIESELAKSINGVKQAEKQLTEQKSNLRRIAGDQQNQRIAISERQAEQSELLEATVNEAGQLQQISSEMAAERKQLQEQQQQSLSTQMSGASLVTGGSISQPVTRPVAPPPPASSAPTPGVPATPAPQPTPAPAPPVVLPNGGYPAYLQNCRVDANALSYGIDPWGYGCRQCVSYTAWKVLQKTGRTAMYWGNAKMWPASAARVGIPSGSQPRVGSVAVMMSGPYGHTAWVESINPNGTLNISQYNYWLSGKPNGGWGWYSEFRNVSPNTYQAYIYV